MTDEPVPSRPEGARGLHQDLTDAAIRRFGAARAAALEAEIAATAETLAAVAVIVLPADSHEPDFVGAASGGSVPPTGAKP